MNGLKTDCDWAALHQRALYNFDSHERIRGDAGAPGKDAPRFHLVRTYHGNIWRLHAELSAASCRSLARLAAREAPLGGAGPPWSPPERTESMLRVLGFENSKRSLSRGPLYRFSMETLGSPEPGRFNLRSLAAKDPAVPSTLGPEFSPLVARAHPNSPIVVATVDDNPTSICFGASSGSGVGIEARVQTLPGYRRSGLGRACLMAWARGVTESGAVPLFSTEWENRGACVLARKSGLALYGESFSIGFPPG
jgi:GNAT superfamily N-acetyltransferase